MAVKIDVRSATWLAVSAHIKERQETLSSQCCGALSWEDTLKARARLNELKGILDLIVDDRPLVEPEIQDVDTNY